MGLLSERRIGSGPLDYYYSRAARKNLTGAAGSAGLENGRNDMSGSGAVEPIETLSCDLHFRQIGSFVVTVETELVCYGRVPSFRSNIGDGFSRCDTE